jgi:ferredoxin-NADP reductase
VSNAFDVRLASVRLLAPGVRELVFERVDREPFEYAAGQWVNLLLPLGGAEPEKRSYSIASAPSGSPRFEIAVTKIDGGLGSTYLHSLRIGATLRALGPHGFFTRPVQDPPSLFIATGTGVAPLRSMMHAALRAGSRAPLWLLFGVRFEEDILYRSEMEAFAREHSGVRFETTLSRGGSTWTGRRGYVQEHVSELLEGLRASSTEPPHVFICGLDRMVSAVKNLVRGDLGVDRKHVHVERYD